MTLLLPEADGIADFVAHRLPGVAVLRYGEAHGGQLDDVTFYCLPYMGDAASIALIGSLPRLAVIQSLSSGVDEVLDAVPPQATLCNGHGLGHEEGTAELALALILASLRQIPRFAAEQSRRAWSHVRTESLDGQRVLLVGYGAIGTAIERRLLPFGATVSRVSRTARPGVSGLDELTGLAAAADILVVCIALHPATRGLINATGPGCPARQRAGHQRRTRACGGRGFAHRRASLRSAARRPRCHRPRTAASDQAGVDDAERADHAAHWRGHHRVRSASRSFRRRPGSQAPRRRTPPQHRPAGRVIRVIRVICS
jgi:hypothetical protein